MWSVWISCSARKFLFLPVLLLWSINTDTVTATQLSWIQVKECAASNYIPSSWHSLFFPSLSLFFSSLSFLCLTLPSFFHPLVTNIQKWGGKKRRAKKRNCNFDLLWINLPAFFSFPFISLSFHFSSISLSNLEWTLWVQFLKLQLLFLDDDLYDAHFNFPNTWCEDSFVKEREIARKRERKGTNHKKHEYIWYTKGGFL